MSTRKISSADLEAAYEVYQGLFFEGSWGGDEELEHELDTWARRALPELHEEWADEGAEVLEMAIRDDDVRQVADFINALPLETRRTAVEGIAQDVSACDDPNAHDLLAALHTLIDQL